MIVLCLNALGWNHGKITTVKSARRRKSQHNRPTVVAWQA